MIQCSYILRSDYYNKSSTLCHHTKLQRNFFSCDENFKIYSLWNSLAVQWLGVCAFTAEGEGSIPDQETKTLQAAQKNKTKQKTTKKRFTLLGQQKINQYSI